MTEHFINMVARACRDAEAETSLDYTPIRWHGFQLVKVQPYYY